MAALAAGFYLGQGLGVVALLGIEKALEVGFVGHKMVKARGCLGEVVQQALAQGTLVSLTKRKNARWGYYDLPRCVAIFKPFLNEICHPKISMGQLQTAKQQTAPFPIKD
nr:hypothetical protein [Tanacetum cinerariifolium]